MEKVICPICKNANTHFFTHGWDSEYRTLERKFQYYYCNNCPVIFLKDPPVDRLEEIYPPTYYSFSDGGLRFLRRIKSFLEIRMFRNILKNISGDNLSVLDIGGGIGDLLSLVKASDSRIKETHVVDFAESARKAAERQGHVFHSQRIEDYKAGRNFDLILLINLLEHVSDPRLIMEKLREIVSPRGLIVIKTPNIDTVDRYFFRNHNWGGLHCPRHWVLFSKSSLCLLAKECGLDVVSFSYTQGAPQWTASILGFLADKDLISISAIRPMHLHPLFGPVAAFTAAFDFLRLPFSKTAQVFCVLKRKCN